MDSHSVSVLRTNIREVKVERVDEECNDGSEKEDMVPIHYNLAVRIQYLVPP
jgi:hypothetical protein